MSPDEHELTPLVQTLLSATRDGKTKWSDGGTGHFVAQFRSGSVVVGTVDDDGGFPYVVQVLDGSGRIIASARSFYFVDEEYGEELPLNEQQLTWNALLGDLFTTARRAALKIDETLQELLDDIRRGAQPVGDDDIPF